MILINFISVLGYILFFSLRFSSLRNIAPLFSLMAILLVLFLGGAAGVLGVTAKIISVVGILLFLGSLPFLIKRKMQILSWGSIFFIILGMVWLYLSKNMTVFGWDEFFWGQFTKVLKYKDAFYGPLDAVLLSHVRYPPGASLLQYFFLTFRDFHEGSLYFANGLIALASLCVLIDFAPRKFISIIFIAAWGGFFITAFYGVPYVSITNDSTLGVLFGAGLCVAAFYKEVSSFTLMLILLPIAAALPLVKEAGLILSFIIVGVYATRVWFDFKFSWKRTLQILVLFLITYCMSKLWNYHLHLVDAMTAPTVSIKDLYSLFSNPTTERQRVVPLRLVMTFISHTSWRYIPLLAMFLWCSFVAHRDAKRELIKDISIAAVITAGLFVYLLMLLIVFAFIFSDYEGMILASYDRYMASYLLGLGFLAGVSFLQLKLNTHLRQAVAIGLIILSVGFAIKLNADLIMTFLRPAHYSQEVTHDLHQVIDPLVKIVDKYVPPNKNVWFIYQNSNGAEAMMLRYEIVPRKVNYWYWSIGKPYSKEDLWTADISEGEFIYYLAGNPKSSFDYLLIARADDKFWDIYGNLFAGNINKTKHYTLFKINRISTRKVIFEPVIAKDLYHP